jgi:hypothetical protein
LSAAGRQAEEDAQGVRGPVRTGTGDHAVASAAQLTEDHTAERRERD